MLWMQFSITTNFGFPDSSVGKEFACNAGDTSSISGLGRSAGEGTGCPLQCSCRGKFPGQRRLVGYSPWGCRESDMTERLSTRPYTVVRNVSCAAKRSDHVAVGQSLSRV